MSGAPIVETPGDKWRAGFARIARISALWRLRGAIVLGGEVSNARAIDGLARLLERQRKTVSERGDDLIAFEDSIGRILHDRTWRAMAIYHTGRFWIEAGRGGRTLRYDLSSLQVMIFCLAPAVLAFVAMNDEGLSSALFVAVFAFGFLYGLNLLIALVRVPGAIRRAVGG